MPPAISPDRLEAIAHAAGFHVLGTDEFGHVRVRHPDTGRRVSLPTTAPTRRTLATTYREILRRMSDPRRAGRPTDPDVHRERARRVVEDLMQPR